MRLPDYPIPDEPVRASWGRVVIDYLRSITPRSSPSILVSTTANGSTFHPIVSASGAGGGSFSGRVWFGNKPKFTIDEDEEGATRFVKILLDGSGYTWESAMPDVQPSDGEVYDLDQTFGDIHLPGNFI